MHKALTAILFILSTFSTAHAEGWYIANNKNPSVMSDDGQWYLFLGKTTTGDLNIYITTRRFNDCNSSGDSTGMYVNGVKVRFYQNCDKTMGIYWYPYTPEGKKHVIGEFMRKQKVEFRDQDFVVTFSAVNFNSTTRDFITEVMDPGL
ncbi:hypothetical protein [Kluyvera georgiana]|uniref:hypothetical protein n=1 Tax=Kluyvera georgiana TaxID=73098 RepID=UPI00080719BA|nr:hypothetical protein [Kluyvera georgiana]